MEQIFRVVSSANKLSFPENEANNFQNEIRPSIQNFQYLGCSRISFFIDKNKIINDEQFKVKNSFFFINCEQIERKPIANQTANLLGDIFVDLKTIEQSSRFFFEFKFDFIYIKSDESQLNLIHITITNLEGELNPVLSGSSVLNLKYTNMEVENSLLRVVSTANLGDYPLNNAQCFTNSIKPFIENVDSIALSKISLPIKYNKVDPEIYPERYTNSYLIKKYDDQRMGSTYFFATFYIAYTPVDAVKPVTLQFPFYVSEAWKIKDFDSIQTPFQNLEDALLHNELMIANYHITSPLFDNYNFNLKLEKSALAYNKYNIIIIPGEQLKNQLIPGSVTYVKCVLASKSSFTFPKFNGFEINICGFNKMNYDADRIYFFGAVEINWFNRNIPISRLVYDSTPNDGDDDLNDLFFIRLENVEGISYGSRLEPIIQIIPINDAFIDNERLNIKIPFASLYFLRTLTNKIDNLSVSILDENLNPHPKVKLDGSTIISFILNYGSNTEVRESSHFEQLFG